MQDFQDHLTITMSGKNRYALLAFLKRHGADKEDVSRFVEEAIVWRIIERENAYRHANEGEEIQLFDPPKEELVTTH